jgi:ATP-binding cassette, subfamily F, member 3
LEHVLGADVERERLLKEQAELTEEALQSHETDANAARLHEIFERLVSIESDKAESKAIRILIGLGFSQQELQKESKKFSGGWRMRIAIAKVIFCEPQILFLDEPTNHLDLNAVIWLEDYLMELDITVVIVSHDREFLNFCCDEIIHLFNQKLNYYKGDYDTFEKVRNEKNKLQARHRET